MKLMFIVTKVVKGAIFAFLILFFSANAFGQEIQNNGIEICNKTISFAPSCLASQEFQSVKSKDFHLSWLYIVQKPGTQGWSIRQESNGEIVYLSEYSMDYIRQKGFSIFPKKNEDVIITPAVFNVLGEVISGNILELKSKKSSSYYLIACGKVCGREMGFQVKLSNKQLSNETLNSELKKIIEFLEN